MLVPVGSEVRINFPGVGSRVVGIPARKVKDNIRQLDVGIHLDADVAGALGNRGEVELEFWLRWNVRLGEVKGERSASRNRATVRSLALDIVL